MADYQLIKANYNDQLHASFIQSLMAGYSADIMGGGKVLADDILAELPIRLARFSGALTFILLHQGKAVGLANCFEGFSTFKAKPLLNIHDFYVAPEFRGFGLSQRLLAAIEQEALLRGCCKVTLEVLTNNVVAKNAYIKFGFSGYELAEEAGSAEFWQKVIVE